MRIRLGGLTLRIERAGNGTPPPSPVVHRRVPPKAAYDALFRIRSTILPVTGLEVFLSPPTMRVMVDAGLSVAAMIPADHAMSEAEAEQHMQRVRTQARRWLCAAAQTPQFRPHPDPDSVDQYNVMLLPDDDLAHIYRLMLEWGSGIFYGTHRADLSPERDPEWIEAQQQTAALVDGLARRYGVLPTALQALDPVEFARCLAIAEAGENEIAKHAPTPGGAR